jgi:hypothetical protein
MKQTSTICVYIYIYIYIYIYVFVFVYMMMQKLILKFVLIWIMHLFHPNSVTIFNQTYLQTGILQSVENECFCHPEIVLECVI